MKERTPRSKVALRRGLVRGAIALVYVLLVGLVFVLGKSHTLLIDNKDLADGSAKALGGVLVSVDGREALELYPGDRDMVLLKGQRHRVSVEAISGGGKTETGLSLPIDADMLLLSLPRLAANQEGFLEPFVQRDQPRPNDEPIGNTNAFTSPDAAPTPPAP